MFFTSPALDLSGEAGGAASSSATNPSSSTTAKEDTTTTTSTPFDYASVPNILDAPGPSSTPTTERPRKKKRRVEERGALGFCCLVSLSSAHLPIDPSSPRLRSSYRSPLSSPAPPSTTMPRPRRLRPPNRDLPVFLCLSQYTSSSELTLTPSPQAPTSARPRPRRPRCAA